MPADHSDHYPAQAAELGKPVDVLYELPAVSAVVVPVVFHSVSEQYASVEFDASHNA